MNLELRDAYEAELHAASKAIVAGHVEPAFHHLERAHILSQRHTSEHVRVHWLMLRLGLTAGAWREVVGQSSRLVAAALFSRIWVPSGNTGRANVSAFRSMPVPDELRSVLDSDVVARR
jgi:Protein of unknown function (DUF3703)